MMARSLRERHRSRLVDCYNFRFWRDSNSRRWISAPVFLDYLALVILLCGLTAVFYTFIYIHDIPYDIAKHRNHPHKEAIHVAGWLSLFTLHAIWPIVFIWAVSHPRPEDVAKKAKQEGDLDQRVAELENRLRALDKKLYDASRKAGKV